MWQQQKTTYITGLTYDKKTKYDKTFEQMKVQYNTEV